MKEADQLIKFLNANGLKTRKTIFTEQVVRKDGRKQDASFAVEYFTGIIPLFGNDYHFRCRYSLYYPE